MKSSNCLLVTEAGSSVILRQQMMMYYTWKRVVTDNEAAQLNLIVTLLNCKITQILI